STCPASRPSKKVRKSASTSCRARRGSKPPTSRRAAKYQPAPSKKAARGGRPFCFLPAFLPGSCSLPGTPWPDRFLQLLVAVQVARTLAGVDLVEGLELRIQPLGEVPVARV